MDSELEKAVVTVRKVANYHDTAFDTELCRVLVYLLDRETVKEPDVYSLADMVKNAQAERDSALAECTRLGNELSRANRTSVDWMSACDDARASLAVSVRDYKALLESSHRDGKVLSAEIDKLKAEVQRLKEANAGESEMRQRAEAKRARSDRDYASLVSNHEMTIRVRDGALAEVERLKGELSDKCDDYDKMGHVRDAQVAEIGRLTTDLNSAQYELKILKAERHLYRNSYDRLRLAALAVSDGVRGLESGCYLVAADAIDALRPLVKES